jgi:PilZ domain
MADKPADQPTDKREFARVAVKLPVTFSGEDLAGGGMTAGISVHGCTLVTEDLLLAGNTVALHIVLPAQSEPLKVDLAEVRWAEGEDCGLEFVRLRLQEKQRLNRFLNALQKRSKGGSK